MRTLVALIALAPAVAAAAEQRFIQDDFEAARVEAQQRKVPIFVEVWAPW